MSDEYWEQQRYDDAYFRLHGHVPGERPCRVLVTGSRALADPAPVEAALRQALADLGPGLVVVHGNARKGADPIADYLARGLGLAVEPHPADWEGPCRPACRPGHRRAARGAGTYCPAAGNYRNQEMVDAGACRCLAFLVAASVSPCSGTRDAIRRAVGAGIPTAVHHPDGRIEHLPGPTVGSRQGLAR